MSIDKQKLIEEGRDDLSLLARMAISRSSLAEEKGVVVMHADASGREALSIPRIRTEIEAAVKKVYGVEVKIV